MAARNEFIQIRANEMERRAIFELAKQQKISASELLRYLIRREAERFNLWPVLEGAEHANG